MNDLIKNINLENNICITGLTFELNIFYVLEKFRLSTENVLVVTNSLYEANQIYNNLLTYTSDVLLFPMDDFLTSVALAISPDLKMKRLETIQSLNSNSKKIVITNLMGYLKYLPKKDEANNYINKIIVNDKIKREDIFKKEITNYMLAKTYQEKTYKNSGLDENGNDKKESSKYGIYVNEANATSTNDMFRLKYPQNLLIELSGMGGNPIAPYGDIKENYKNTINSNLDSIKYTLKVASIAQMISESAYQVIKKFEGKVEYQEVTEVQDIIYKEFAKKIKSMQTNKEEKEIEENDR